MTAICSRMAYLDYIRHGALAVPALSSICWYAYLCRHRGVNALQGAFLESSVLAAVVTIGLIGLSEALQF